MPKSVVKSRPKRLAKKILEIGKKNLGKGKPLPPLGQVMKSVGYSDSYSANPQQLKGTETWDELMKIFLPDSLIAQRHHELLNHGEISHFIFPLKELSKKEREKKEDSQINDDEIKMVIESVPGCKLIYIKRDKYFGAVAYFQAPSGRIRKDALDMSYKLKAKYAPDKIELTKRKYQDMSNAELAAHINRLKNFLLKK